MKHDPSVVDSVLLEWICAIEGYKSDHSRIKYIYPLFSGRRDPVTGEVGSIFDCEEFKQIPDIIPQATLSAAESLLTANKVFLITPTGFNTKTVKSIVTAISEFKGLSVDDDKTANKVFLITPTGFNTKTVKSIVTAISSEFKGLSVDDDKQKNFLTICAENLIKILDNHLSTSAADSDVSKMREVEVRMASLR